MMKFSRRIWRSWAFLTLILLGVIISGCLMPKSEKALHRYEFQQPHMGMLFTLTLYAPDPAAAQSASTAAFARIAHLNNLLTDYDPESELMQLCQQPGGTAVRVSPELFTILAEARRIAEISGGAFDPTIGPVVRLWRRARRTEVLPPPAQLATARSRVGWQNISLNPDQQTVTLLTNDMQLDLGGIAKGYAADEALRVLREHGITRALVAASGDVAVGDPPPGQDHWRVAIGTPFQREGVGRALMLANAAVSTSGDSEQFVVIGGIRYSHIVDPRTGVGLTNRCQVSVVASRATETDALATAISILGAEAGRSLMETQAGVSAIIYQETATGVETIEVRRRK
jgi:thiamine biosynthesis lipoprotein